MRDPRDDRGPDDPLPGDGPDDQEMYDRAFAELIEQFEVLADDPQPVEEEPLPSPVEPEAGPLPPFHFRLDDLALPDDDEPADLVPESEQFVPPNPPWPRPTAPLLIGWLGVGYAIVAMLLIAFGVPLPRWVGWLAVLGFVGGLVLLLSRLPRHRPPDDDGAQL
ncbi:hypothetical protein FOE78_18480 [Microlunatus elymi]|uniref:Uncharacterized protein n=1 Tax=Microlunatus elymi TaxID=2596828 RepID=A0A516Q342_9ACTN|nr:hypothetical protein [Microlunatus elymi]QDP97631.1 hypothetical protein FOE78_18480 [Microlunatus elymi]